MALRSLSSLSLLAPAGRASHNPLLVYLPGMDGTGELLFVQIPHLADHFDIRCLVIPSDDLSSWQRMASQVMRLIRQEANHRPVYLCGESFGACLAMQVVDQAPDMASQLILINPASSFHRIPWLHWMAHLTDWIWPTLYNTSALGSLPLLANLSRIRSDYHGILLNAIRSVSQPSAAWRLSLLSKFRPELLNLRRFRQPTLIIASQADRLLPSQAEAQRLASLFPCAQIHLLANSGHISLLEEEINLGQILTETGVVPQPDAYSEVATSAA
jgi:pimeloyl-ACP methyl ester carboxylesterase